MRVEVRVTARPGVPTFHPMQMEMSFPGGIAINVENVKRLRALNRGSAHGRSRTGSGHLLQAALNF